MSVRKISLGLSLALLFLFVTTLRAQDIPRLGARYNYRYYDCRIEANHFTLTGKVKLTIYNKVGEDYRYVALSESNLIKLKDVKIRVVDSGGNTIYEKNQNDMTKYCGYDGTSLYSDICHYQIELRANQFPYSIEYEYTNEFKSLFFWSGKDFQFYIPVDTIEYNLETYPGFTYQYKIYGGDIDYAVRTKDGRRVETFSAAAVPALENIDYLPSGARLPLSIEFAADAFEMEGFRMSNLSWDGIGDWYNKIAESQYDFNYQSSASAEPVLDAYNSVIDNVRYVAIQIGLGGWQPYKAELTRERGFGDCKDMATLLISELQNNGIAAYPVLVLTKDEGLIDVDFPDTRFNHVITLAIDGTDSVWMDATCNSCPLGELPFNDEDIDVLLVTPQGGVITRTPASSSYDNRQIRNTSIFIRSDLLCELEVTRTAYGNFGLYLRSRFDGVDKEDIKNYLERLLPGESNKYKLIDYEVDNLEDIEKPITVRAKYHSKKKIDKLGPNYYVDPFLFNKTGGIETLDLTDREYPIKISYPIAYIDTISVSWDSSLSFSQFKLPQADSVIGDFGYFKTSSRTDSLTVVTTFDEAFEVYRINPEQFEIFGQFQAKLKEVTGQHIKLSK